MNRGMIYHTSISHPLIVTLWLVFCSTAAVHAVGIELQNQELSLRLDIDRYGLPFLERISWRKNGDVIFSAKESGFGFQNWVKNSFPNNPEQNLSSTKWNLESDHLYHRAKASCRFGHIEIVTHLDLARHANMIKTYIEIVNHGSFTQIETFPIWFAELTLPGASDLLYWNALSYKPQREKLIPSNQTVLHSKTYSSDTRESSGQVPFWVLYGEKQGIGFGLEWSGGWQAEISMIAASIKLNVTLPPEETQLSLKPEERMVGPILQFIPLKGSSEIERRQCWLKERQTLAHATWDMPEPSYPLIYNHWYSVRFNLNGEFIRNQVAAMSPYGFDVFVVDAGWYADVGDWIPDPHKFEAGEFESALQIVKDKGIKIGIWSCPWLKRIKKEQTAPEIDEPPYINKFMDSYSIDLAGADFTELLNHHITDLERQFHIDWWKYDQEFLGKESRHGRMKKMTALQSALETVRQNHPTLSIESCMSGGRMINAFTDAIAQIHWIRDGSGSGYEHGRSNILEALGAAQFLSPNKVQRWTNRLNTILPDNPELLKWYCRSCMIGVWGISADMRLINKSQQQIILQEVEHYRKLNPIKSSLLYQIQYPEADGNLVSIVYYDASKCNAAILVFRWNAKGAIHERLKLQDWFLDKDMDIIDCDRKTTVHQTGSNLVRNGFDIVLPPKQLSNIYFLHATKTQER